MTSDPVVVAQQDGMVVLRSGMRTIWLTPLDALDLGQEIATVAEQAGNEAVAAARAERKALA